MPLPMLIGKEKNNYPNATMKTISFPLIGLPELTIFSNPSISCTLMKHFLNGISLLLLRLTVKMMMMRG